MNTTTLSAARRDARQGILWIALAAVMWGTVGVATRGLYEISTTNPLSIGFFRLAISIPALAIACWRVQGRAMFQVSKRDLGIMALIGVMMAFYQVCYFASIARVGVTIAVLVTLCTAPVMVALLATIFLREHVTGRIVLSLVGALAGTVLLVGLDHAGNAQQRTFEGVLLALGSAFGYAVITLCSRALAGRYHPLQSTTIGFTAGALVLLPFALATGLVATYPLTGWALLLHLGLIPTALAYWFFFSAMRTVPATVASITTLLEPLTSALLAAIIFGEQLSSTGVIGAALLLGAMSLLFRSGND